MGKIICDWISLGILIAACFLSIRMYFGRGDD